MLFARGGEGSQEGTRPSDVVLSPQTAHLSSERWVWASRSAWPLPHWAPEGNLPVGSTGTRCHHTPTMAATSTRTLRSPSPSERLQGGSLRPALCPTWRCPGYPQPAAVLFVASGSDGHTGKTKLKSNPGSPSARRAQQDSPFISLSW